jgi:hypothetical protein
VTDREFAEFVLEMRGSFQGEIAPERLAAIQRVAAGWRFDDARRALHRLLADGRTFVPVPGELVRALEMAHGGRGSFRAGAALAGQTVAEHTAERQEQAVALMRASSEHVERLEAARLPDSGGPRRSLLERVRELRA